MPKVAIDLSGNEDCCLRCGEAHAVPGTRLHAVFVQAYGDCCHILPELYDPETKQFIHAETWERSSTPFGDVHAVFSNAWICAQGDVYILNQSIFRVGLGRVGDVGWAGDGNPCLDGGSYFAGQEVPHGCGKCDGCPG